MSQIEEIMQKCAELGKSIANTKIYKDFKQAEYDLLHNPEARKLMEDLQKLQQDQYRRKIAGIELTNEEKDKIKEMENLCLKDSQIFASNNANTKFQEFMEQISKKIREGIKSIEGQ